MPPKLIHAIAYGMICFFKEMSGIPLYVCTTLPPSSLTDYSLPSFTEIQSRSCTLKVYNLMIRCTANVLNLSKQIPFPPPVTDLLPLGGSLAVLAVCLYQEVMLGGTSDASVPIVVGAKGSLPPKRATLAY